MRQIKKSKYFFISYFFSKNKFLNSSLRVPLYTLDEWDESRFIPHGPENKSNRKMMVNVKT